MCIHRAEHAWTVPLCRDDEREVETEHGMRLLRHSRGNPETDYVEAYPTAPPLDSTLSQAWGYATDSTL
jgi:hypothetical protein